MREVNGMSLEQGMAHLVSKTWKDIRKQEFVPCWKLDEKAKRHTSERYMLMKTFPLIKTW